MTAKTPQEANERLLAWAAQTGRLTTHLKHVPAPVNPMTGRSFSPEARAAMRPSSAVKAGGRVNTWLEKAPAVEPKRWLKMT